MDLRTPDPEFTASHRARSNFRLAIRLTLVFVTVVWLVYAIDRLLGLELARFGLRPREADGLLGLVTTPLLHGSLTHIASNSLPLFVGGVAMLFLYPNSALRALPAIYIGSAALAWIFARPSIHIGASGLVYGILAFVFVSGILRRDLRSVGVSLMIWFFYGSMVWGVLPTQPGTSWELHASGMAIGVIMAVLYRRWDLPPLKRYDWEDEEDEDNEFEWEQDHDHDAWKHDRHH
ncbi:rhomboid family intramembrane serine protease [Wenzhouxiangella sp. AB-CW3]|uniref:rhomboid family intramembrane serine protease n=1 Tax=Wenzhouxiangella sp. AB-CW3 TaxID=2771012 RepID=UPI00168BEAE8|nr:rhomboid family intramembrane serine protease [Wenzhouxiangella sp. AB-CW3]QOC21146.1 rhomboid family intramembrane serine protease [Wenzhouxiangella sp. AB-CW3]